LKTICFVINSRANYARIKSTITFAKKSKLLKTVVIVGASGLLPNFGRIDEIMEQDGIEIDYKVYSVVSGDNPENMAKTTGLAIIELSSIFAKVNPNFVVSVADRYETLGTVIAASYMNIPVIHTQGGEISGSIDESVRHACSKLSHIHFPATQKSAENIKQLGEDPKSIFVTGCPSIDLAKQTTNIQIDKVFEKYSGVGFTLNLSDPYLLISQHSVTTNYLDSRQQILQTLDAIKKLEIQSVWLWPNIDSGSDEISKALRQFREKEPDHKIRFYRNFTAEDYIRILKGALCIIGNSSSCIRESAFLGVPSVVIGDRQFGREHGENVMFSDYNSLEIYSKVTQQIEHGKYESSFLFGDGNAGERMVKIIETLEPNLQKYFFRTND
jgi:UDP-hydrolysing UDP-N-acetyl-D-glucosamine 2-epimerase